LISSFFKVLKYRSIGELSYGYPISLLHQISQSSR